jgi:uncharacterized lipoprotein
MFFSKPSLRFAALIAVSAISLWGCGTTRSCGGDQQYLQARERPPLQMPAGVTGSERMTATQMVVPPASPTPDKLDPSPRCLDEPPGYFKRVGPKAAAGSAEEAVNVWALAWASRKADQVASFYSPSFAAPDGGGATSFIDQRKQQVLTGKPPEARLQDVTSTAQGDDRKVVTFVQKFGDSAVRKELTLVREASGWRIVAERTIEVL